VGERGEGGKEKGDFRTGSDSGGGGEKGRKTTWGKGGGVAINCSSRLRQWNRKKKERKKERGAPSQST